MSSVEVWHIFLANVVFYLFDYSLKDYQNSHIGPNDNDVFIALNNQIDQNWRLVSNFRVGGEYRLGGLSFRAGYHLEESQYNNKKLLGDEFWFLIRNWI